MSDDQKIEKLEHRIAVLEEIVQQLVEQLNRVGSSTAYAPIALKRAAR